MGTADQLQEQIDSLIKEREGCAEQLLKLAQELESLRKKCNVGEGLGSSALVAGAASLIGAGVATLVTGGAAAPVLGLLTVSEAGAVGAVCSGLGVALSLGTKLTEHIVTSSTMKTAQEKEKKYKEIAKNIKKLFQKLEKMKEMEEMKKKMKEMEEMKKKMKEMEEEMRLASSGADPDELDRRVMNEIVRAMARRHSQQWQIDFTPNSGSFPAPPDCPSNSELLHIPTDLAVMTALAGILAIFALEGSGKKMKALFVKGAEKLIRELSTIGLKTVVKGGAMVAGGAVGMWFALPELMETIKKAREDNHVTEASELLRETAKKILMFCQSLKKQLDEIRAKCSGSVSRPMKKGTADQLLDQIFSWIEESEGYAEQLLKLAQELESLREKCNVGEGLGSSALVAGAASLIGAGVATLVTGGAAAPVLGLLTVSEAGAVGAVCSGLGVTLSLGTKLTEHIVTSSTMKTAQEKEKKSNEMAENIKKLFQQLKEEERKQMEEMKKKMEEQRKKMEEEMKKMEEEMKKMEEEMRLAS